MKVGEARATYGAQLKEYNKQKFKLAQQKKALEEKMNRTENGAVVYADEAAKLELMYSALDEKQEEYQKYMDQLMGQWEMEFDRVAMEQQKDSAKETGQDLGKILTVARRIMHGDIVPQSDEKKLMEYDGDLYQMAKNIGAMAKLKKKKKYDSLWEEKEKKEQEDPMKAADGQDAISDGPEIVDVGEVMAAATDTAEMQE